MHEEKQSILIIGINFFPEPTGIGKYTGEMAFSLAEKGYAVDVITAVPYYPQWKVYDGYTNYWYKTELMKAVHVTRCPLYVPGSLSGFKRIFQDLSFFLTAFGNLFLKILSGKQYDLVFVASPSFMSGFLGLFYRFFYRKAKLVYHIQDLQVDAAEELGMIKKGILLKLLKQAEGYILRNADWITTISKGMEEKIRDKPFKIKRQYLFPNWVDFGSIYKKAPDWEAISHLGFPPDKRLVFYSGAVGEKQGLELILEAAKLAAHQLPEIIFLIAGSGPYADTLKDTANDYKLNNVFFIDLQPTRIFNELLNFAYVHLVIQKDKAGDLLLPSKLTNILAVGGIAIVTASPNTTLYNIISANNVGIITEPENLDAFWNALVSTYTQTDEVEQLKKNALEYANRQLKKDTIIDSFLVEMNLVKQSNAKAIAI
jgi:colanic acid biosynthesis glycosyl transferase WcaI